MWCYHDSLVIPSRVNFKHLCSHLALECIPTCVSREHLWSHLSSLLYMQINTRLHYTDSCQMSNKQDIMNINEARVQWPHLYNYFDISTFQIHLSLYMRVIEIFLPFKTCHLVEWSNKCYEWSKSIEYLKTMPKASVSTDKRHTRWSF